MEAVETVRKQHSELLSIFDELRITIDDLELTRLLAQIAERLKTHTAVEEEVFYPAVRTLGPEAAALVEESLAAHRAVDLVLDESLGGEPTDANVKVLHDIVSRHIEDEERRMFPIVERFDDAAQARLAARIDRRTDELEEEEEEDEELRSAR
jgi:hemerythrin superfamily protein